MPDPQRSPSAGDAVPETSLRKVDEAVVEWLQYLTFRSQHPKVITVWQSRQFASTAEINPVTGQKSAYPLPVVTVAMSSIAPALDRRIVANIYNLGLPTSRSVPQQGVATGTGAISSYEGRLGALNIVPGTVTFTDGSQSMSDDGEGDFTGDTTTRSEINYDTGRYLIEFTATPALDAAVRASYSFSSAKMYTGNQNNEVYVLPFPIPYDLSYQVDIWTKTQQDMQMLRGSLLSRFSYADETFISANFGHYGQKLIPLQLSRVDDSTNLEPEEGDKELRNTVTFTAKAWIFQVPVRTKVIQSVNVALLDGSSPLSDNLVDGSAFLDWYCNTDHYTFSGSEPPTLSSVQESPDFIPPDRALAFFSWVDGELTNTGP